MTDPQIPICPSAELIDGGKGRRFALSEYGRNETGFVVRYHGAAYAYLNRCAHVPIELDWAEGEFFESSGLYLMCATHGAIYDPQTGQCLGGPCRGGRLHPIAVVEQEHTLFWQPNERLRPPIESSSQEKEPNNE